jgi:hypothetical protein
MISGSLLCLLGRLYLLLRSGNRVQLRQIVQIDHFSLPKRCVVAMSHYFLASRHRLH